MGMTSETSKFSLDGFVQKRYLIILLFSAFMHVLWILGSSPIYQPDAGNYALSAMLLQNGWDVFATSIGSNRVPGYSLFMGAIVWPFGKHGMLVLLIVQHALLVWGSVLVVKISDELNPDGILGFVAGIISCFCFQLYGYANQPMSEVPYAFLLTSGVFFAARYLKTDNGIKLFYAVACFSIATLFRPAAKILPWLLMGIVVLRAIWPRFLYSEHRVVRGIHTFQRFIIGSLVACSILSPWAVYNFVSNGHFSLTGTLGLNLYSNTIEYGGFWDEESKDFNRIRDAYPVGREKRLADNIPTDGAATWRQHMSAMGHFIAAEDMSMWNADQVFVNAAVDAIKAHPDLYIRHVFRTIVQSMIYTDLTFLALPGFDENAPRPLIFNYSKDLDNWLSPMTVTKEIIDSFGFEVSNPIRFYEPTIVTPVIGVLSNLYAGLSLRWIIGFSIFVCGLVICLWQAFASRSPISWLLLAFFGFQVVITAMVVPGSARYRMPGDLVFSIILALPFVFTWKQFNKSKI
ncbi:hypothetical protein N8000_05800 [Rhodospirillales bacterium]|nr:hypothetical protein [Rhodospirillales bacterium]